MDKSTFGGKARFRCEKGYNMSGSRELECLANGDWNGKFPTCNIVGEFGHKITGTDKETFEE